MKATVKIMGAAGRLKSDRDIPVDPGTQGVLTPAMGGATIALWTTKTSPKKAISTHSAQ